MKKTITAVEINESDIKLFQGAEKSGSMILTHCEVRPISSNYDEDIAEHLRGMAAFLPSEPKQVLVIMPRRHVILRHMKFPTDDPMEIEDMVGLQLINKLPYPVEDVIYRHEVLGYDLDRNSLVLACVVSKEISRRYCRIIEQAGWEPGKLVLNSQGIARWLGYQESALKVSSHKTTAIINIDRTHSEICFCQNDRLIYSRHLPQGYGHLNAGQAQELEKQIVITLQAYDKERMGPAVGNVLILGLRDEAKILQDILASNDKVQTNILKPVYGIAGLTKIEHMMAEAQRTASLTAGLGFILSRGREPMNLAPIEIKQTRHRKRQKWQAVKTGALLAMTVILGVAIQLTGLTHKRSVLRSVKTMREALSGRLVSAEERIKLVERFDRKDRQVTFIPDLIDELSRLTPDDVIFRTITVDKDGHVNILGYAESNAQVNDMRTQMVRSMSFHDVDLKFATKRTIAKRPLIDFKIASKLGQNEAIEK